MAKNARERAVKERRALKLQKKRDAAQIRLEGADEATQPTEEQDGPLVRLVPAELGDVPEMGSPQMNGGAAAPAPPASVPEDSER